MSTGFAFKQRFHLCSVSNLRILLVFQLVRAGIEPGILDRKSSVITS